MSIVLVDIMPVIVFFIISIVVIVIASRNIKLLGGE
jgi:hypothetical protein